MHPSQNGQGQGLAKGSQEMRWFVGVVVWMSLVIVISAQQPGRTIRDGVFTRAQAARGAEGFEQVCADCHGVGLTGSDEIPALTGPMFARIWNGVPVSELFERIRVAMPADAPATLDRQQVADLVAYILSANGAPAGEVELPRDAAPLKTIRITELK